MSGAPPEYTAYHVSRGQLLSWVNEELEVSITKIEEVSNGAIFCQLVHKFMPKVNLPMNKVHFHASTNAEILQNYKVLQSTFTKNHITKVIDIDELMKGKPMANTEFLQWLKWYVENFGSSRDEEYVPAEERRHTAVSRMHRPPTHTKTKAKSTPLEAAAHNKAKSAPMAEKVAANKIPKVKILEDKLEQVMFERAEDKLLMSAMEQERDFYFGKLRDVEELCRRAEKCGEDAASAEGGLDLKNIIDQIKNILYEGPAEESSAPKPEPVGIIATSPLKPIPGDHVQENVPAGSATKLPGTPGEKAFLTPPQSPKVLSNRSPMASMR
eukprot:scaffold48_cov395-Prasinococcus_capsulatus_cf.AAC.43